MIGLFLLTIKNMLMPVQKSELQKAIEEGYVETFSFDGAELISLAHPLKRYNILDVSKSIHPCLLTQTIVYRIECKNGLKGVVVLRMTDFTDDWFY